MNYNAHYRKPSLFTKLKHLLFFRKDHLCILLNDDEVQCTICNNIFNLKTK